MSKCNCHEEKEVCCKKEKEVCCKKEKEVCCRKEGTPVLLKCGCPGSVTLPVIALGGVLTGTPSFTVSTVTLNTCDFCDPCIKFEVASNINITVGVGIPITLNYQIFKICRNQFAPIPVGPIFTFSRALSVLQSEAFSFFVCDCDVCPDECCTYSLVVTVASLGVALGASITNATISALVVEDNHC